MLLNPYLATTGVGTGGGVSYFFEERFEGTGYQNSWTETGTGTIDEDFSTSGISMEGSQCLRLAASAQSPRINAVLPSDQAELWLFFKLRVVTGLSASRSIVAMLDSGGTLMCGCQLNTTNIMAAVTTTVATAVSVDALSPATTYNIWFHVRKGTGSNGFCSVGFSTGTTEVTAGNAYVDKANGANTNDFHSIQVQCTNVAGTNTTGEIILDQILMSTTGTIGNNPA